MGQLIDGVTTRPLRVIPDERGYLMEMMRNDWPEFRRFGQVYLTVAYPGIIKAWHFHKVQWDHFICVQGMARVVLFDQRADSPTHGLINEFHIGILQPILLAIPPMVCHGFTAEGIEAALIVNVPTELYNYQNPDEHRLAYDDPRIPYRWETRHG